MVAKILNKDVGFTAFLFAIIPTSLFYILQNPYLGSPEFGELVEFSDSETDFYHIIDCHMYEEKDVNKFFHMLFEDVPDLVEIANSIQKDSDRDQYSLETLWENGNCSMTPPNELVVREISNTLIKLMKKRFVDEFA